MFVPFCVILPFHNFFLHEFKSNQTPLVSPHPCVYSRSFVGTKDYHSQTRYWFPVLQAKDSRKMHEHSSDIQSSFPFWFTLATMYSLSNKKRFHSILFTWCNDRFCHFSFLFRNLVQGISERFIFLIYFICTTLATILKAHWFPLFPHSSTRPVLSKALYPRW